MSGLLVRRRKHGVAVELHAAHIPILLEVVRAEKARCVDRWNAGDYAEQYRSNAFREIEFRLAWAMGVWKAPRKPWWRFW